MIDIHIIVYYLNLYNIYNTVKTNLIIINWFLAYYIPILFDIKSIKIKKQVLSLNFNFMILLVLFFFNNQDQIFNYFG